MIKKWLIFALCWAILLSTAIIAKPGLVFACSCAMAPSPETQVKEELNRKTAIFAGKVTKVTQPRQSKIISSVDLVKVSFEVSTVWKGDLKQQTIVYTAMSSASCGYESFQEGKGYIVSAYESSGQLETGICELTKPLDLAEEELKVLGEGYAPIPIGTKEALPSNDEPAEADHKDNTSKIPFIIGTVVVLAVIATVIRRIMSSRSS